MYVWKNQNHRDRRKRPKPPMGYKAAPAVVPDLSSRVERDLEMKARAAAKFVKVAGSLAGRLHAGPEARAPGPPAKWAWSGPVFD